MTSTGKLSQLAITLIAIIATCAALMAASSVFAPLALALFVIALVWPLQKAHRDFLRRRVWRSSAAWRSYSWPSRCSDG